ncbi:MAG: hypothetical protein AAFO94_18800, partial [Bacteroidota bacterium]
MTYLHVRNETILIQKNSFDLFALRLLNRSAGPAWRTDLKIVIRLKLSQVGEPNVISVQAKLG